MTAAFFREFLSSRLSAREERDTVHGPVMIVAALALAIAWPGAAAAQVDAKAEREAAVKAEQAGDWDAALLHYENIYDSTPGTPEEKVALRHKFAELQPKIRPNEDPAKAGETWVRAYAFRSWNFQGGSNAYNEAQLQAIDRATAAWADAVWKATRGHLRVKWETVILDQPLTAWCGFPAHECCMSYLTDLKQGEADIVMVYVKAGGLPCTVWADTSDAVCKGAMWAGFNDGGDGATCGDGEIQMHEWLHAVQMTFENHLGYQGGLMVNVDCGMNCGPNCWQPKADEGGLYNWYRHLVSVHATRAMWRNFSVGKPVENLWSATNSPVQVRTRGLAAEKDPKAEPNIFRDSLTLTMVPRAGGQVRYTLNRAAPIGPGTAGSVEPTTNSTLYTGPIRLADTTYVRAKHFDVKGVPFSKEFRLLYELCPIEMKTETTPDPTLPPVINIPGTDMRVFNKALKITLRSALPGGQIRYTIDGVALKSPTNGLAYKRPITLTAPAYFGAQDFDKDGRPRGKPISTCFYTYEKSLTTGKPVTSSGYGEPCEPKNAVDGCTYHEQSWMANGSPNWLKVDLQKVYGVNKVHVFPYWTRHFEYTVDLSTDGTNWVTVADHSKTDKAILSTAEGDMFQFKPTPGRYLRINNCGIVVEVRAYGEELK